MIVSQATPVVEAFVGFRRRFRVCPQANSITVAVEDDFHCMNLVKLLKCIDYISGLHIAITTT